MIEITVRDFIENIRKNGLPKGHGTLFSIPVPNDESGQEYVEANSTLYLIAAVLNPSYKVGAACAFGQGLINSGAYFNPYDNNDDLLQDLYNKTWELNDQKYHSDIDFNRISDELLSKFEADLYTILELKEFDYSPYLP